MTKKRKISITTLALCSAASIVAAAALLGGTLTADADRSVTLNGGNFFYTANQAEIRNEAVGDEHYTAFAFADDDSAVTYRKNLAYSWVSSVRDSEGEPTAEGAQGMLSTEIGFASVNFETFTIKFQSQQYSQTEEGVTDNYITFVASENADGVYVGIGDPLPDGTTEEDETKREEMLEEITSGTMLSYDRLTISFTDRVQGSYEVTVTDSNDNSVVGMFENIGGTYARYVSSSNSTSVIPLTYSAQFADDATEGAVMYLFSFNGQSFALGDNGSLTVNDNTAPVLCLDEEVTTLEYGRSLDVNYTVIDMLATSPRSTVYYYVLKEDQQSGNVDLNETGDTGYFRQISSSDIAPIIAGKDPYLPQDDPEDADYTTQCLVKVYVSVQDSTASGNNSDKIFLDWYVPEEYKCTVTANNAGGDFDFIRATTDTRGAAYVGDIAEITDGDNESSYQYAVNTALEEQKAVAGDGNYFYLPSFENFIRDNVTAYRDLTFSIYYISAGSDSATSLDYNELAIELENEGLYRFAIYATDAEGNNMYYLDEDGREVEFAASELTALLEDPAESDLAEYVPVFQFDVNYEGLSVTDPEGQDIGFVGTTYSVPDFDVTGLSSQYETTYTLYVFDRYAYYGKYGTISYSEFINRAEELFENDREFFREIPAEADLEEADPDYDELAAYEWDPDGLSFVPQDENTFYLVRMEARDTTFVTTPLTSVMAISVSAAADPINVAENWVENNVASVVLLSVAGAALIGIILLVVIKPKDKGDIDQLDEAETSRTSRKKSKK